MSFMQKQIRFSTWLKIECVDGTYYEDAGGVPIINTVREGHVVDVYDPRFESFCEAYGDLYPSALVCSFERLDGWGARLSAPGYLDCTEWMVFPTRKEAEKYLDDYVSDD